MKKFVKILMAIVVFSTCAVSTVLASDETQSLPPLEDNGNQLPYLGKILVSKFKLEGNTVYSDEELGEILASYENREITAEEMHEAKDKLTQFYIVNGYRNSGVIIPNQEVKDGVITLRVIEGKLSRVEVSGNKWLRTGYVRKRLELATKGGKQPFNVNTMQQRLQLLKQDPRIDNIHANFGPGLELGEGILDVQIEEARPYYMALVFNNHNSPSIGSYRGEINIGHNNLTGFGDSLNAQYALTEGLDEYSVNYSIPLTRRDTTLTLSFERAEPVVIAEPFDELNIESETMTCSASLRHPFYKTVSREFAMELKLERSQSKTLLNGVPYSFTSYAEEDEDEKDYKVCALRFSQEWVDRSMTQVLAIRSTFSFGLDMLDATIDLSKEVTGADPDAPDARFFTWLGQFQWLRRVNFLNSQLLFRTDLRFSNNPLLPVEKFAIGGSSTVRGYRENQLTTDNGVISSLEWRIGLGKLKMPWLSKGPNDGMVQLCPFFDFGRGWNTDSEDPDPDTVYSAGIGARWSVNNNINAEIYWGKSLESVPDPSEYNLQDDGIHFNIRIGMF
ncbi:MAG: ShlB/FhaC/HecB family hemolysin secretion/activation protein [Desulfobacterales bacterium]|nr:ShlB/FhaC/HecB family hemolysin secretion/activation protein [Desulfobacterales bacterium]